MSSDPQKPPEMKVTEADNSESKAAKASKEESAGANAPAPNVIEKAAKDRRAAIVALSLVAIVITYILISNLLGRDDDAQRRVAEAPTQPAIGTDFLVQEAERLVARDARLKTIEARKRKAEEARRLAEQQQRLEALLAKRSRSGTSTHSNGSRFSSLLPSGGFSGAGGIGGDGQEPGPSAPVAEAIDRAALYRALAGETPNGPQRAADEGRGGYTPNHAVAHRVDGVYLRAGTSIPATLLSRVLTGRPGPVQAVVAHDVYASGSDRRVLIPAGTRLLGINDGQTDAGDRTLDVAWQRLIYQDGATLMLEDGVTVAGDGAAGLRGKVHNHWPSLYGHAFLTSLTGAIAQVSQGRGRQAGDASRGEDAASTLGRNLAEVTREIARRNLQRPPTIDVPAGASLAITLLEDLVFSSAGDSGGRSR